MKNLHIAALLIPSIAMAGSSDAHLLRIFSEAQRVDKQAEATLHLSIRAIALLLEANSSTFQPQSILDREGTMAVLLDLQHKGYVTITSRKGLPDGNEKTVDFVQYVPTDSGKMIISALTP